MFEGRTMRRAIAILVAACTVLASGNTYAASMFTLPSGVRVEIVESPFQKSKFEVFGCGDSSSACRINGHVPYGVAFGLPKTYVKAITVSYQGHSYSLDSSDMYDAWGERPLKVKDVIRYFGGKCSDVKNCEFRGVFSDGAGTFVAEWLIVDGMPIRDVLTDSSDVIDLFMHNIDPPETE